MEGEGGGVMGTNCGGQSAMERTGQMCRIIHCFIAKMHGIHFRRKQRMLWCSGLSQRMVQLPNLGSDPSNGLNFNQI